ncbi:MAG TPA: CAP domain-containing protein [Waterburya sp.]|jgi:uncharacterized protein YkwD
MQYHSTKTIFGLLFLVAGMSSCAGSSLDSRSLPFLSDKSTPTTVAQRATPSQFAAMEQSVHQQVNQYRKSHNLPPLKWNAQIAQQARIHSQAMASGKVPFSHNGFEGRVKAIAKSIPYRRAGENVAYNLGYADPGKQAVEGWIKSTGHRHNMEGNFDLTGIGIAKNAKGEYYLTQIFIKHR